MKNKKIITVEFCIYLIIVILGFIFRIINLGGLPLSDYEARITLDGLNLISNQNETMKSDQTILVNSLGFLYYLFGTSNFISRLVPAIIGSMLVFLPALFRKNFNNNALLILSFWIAISPTFVSLSRQVDSTLIFLLSFTLFVYYLLNKKILKSAIFLIVALLCGKVFFWNFVVLSITSLYVFLFINKNEFSLKERIQDLKSEYNWKKFLIISIIAYIFISTFGFIFLEQFSGVGRGFTAFLNVFSNPSNSVLSLGNIVRGLLFYEIAAIIFGLMGLIWVIRKNQFVGLFLLGMITINTILMILVSEKLIIWNLWTIIPLMIAGSFFINHFITIPKHYTKKIVVVTLVGLSILFFITLAFIAMFSNSNQPSEQDNVRLLFILAGLAMIIGAGLLAGWALSWEIAGKSFLLLFVSYFFIITISSMWNASGLRYPNYNEILRIDSVPIEEDLLIGTLQDFSSWNYGNKSEINIFVINNRTPSLEWVLRDFSNVNFVTVLPLEKTIDAIVTKNDQIIEQGDSYRGQEILWTSEPDWMNMNIREVIQWFLTRRAPQNVLSQNSLIVWIKNSLVSGYESIN